jgi:hypothetical protein
MPFLKTSFESLAPMMHACDRTPCQLIRGEAFLLASRLDNLAPARKKKDEQWSYAVNASERLKTEYSRPSNSYQ